MVFAQEKPVKVNVQQGAMIIPPILRTTITKSRLKRKGY